MCCVTSWDQRVGPTSADSSGRLEEAAVAAASSPAPAAAVAARVAAVGGAGPVVLSPLMAGPLTVASAAVAAVAVHGAGGWRAGVFSGSLPLGWPAAKSWADLQDLHILVYCIWHTQNITFLISGFFIFLCQFLTV